MSSFSPKMLEVWQAPLSEHLSPYAPGKVPFNDVQSFIEQEMKRQEQQ